MATTTGATSGTGVLQSLGVGSGIDIGTLVTQLVTAEMTPASNRIQRQATSVGTQISALGQLKGALSTFQQALNKLHTVNDFQIHSASSGDEDVFTATTAAGAAPGTYQVTVDHIATAQQLLGEAFVGDSKTNVGTGTLTVSLGDKTFTVTIDDPHSTLAGIRNAINTATGNPGVTATLVNGTDGTHLVLTSALTGAANTIKVTSDDAALAPLTYAPGNTTHYSPLKGAQNSSVTIAGVTHTSASNTVADAIDGVTLQLKSENPGTPIALTVTNDPSAVSDNVNGFVIAYNALVGVVTKLGGYDSTTQTAGPLLGQSLISTLQNQLGRGLVNAVPSATGSYNSLASLGITTNKDGTLSLDTTKLSKALSTDFGAVSTVFAASDGVAARLSTFVDAQLSSTASIATRNKTLTVQQKQITNDQADLQRRAQQLTARYQAQFTAMDSLLAGMQQTSSYLTQQLAGLASLTNNSGK